MLHIHNGDSTANTARQSSLPGEHFAFREALIEGPTPAGVEGAEWRIVRARHLWTSYGVDLKECGQELLAQEKKLASFAEHDEVVLWFEHDLFCQVNLIYLLSWFGQQQLGKTKLRLICIDEFPGKEDFRGLGKLNARELASLFPRRTQVTSEQLKLGASAWQAYCSSNPTDIEKVLQTDTSPLPFLKPALQAHLKRFPSTGNGLGRIEEKGLELIHEGAERFIELFARFGDAEPVYGLGDAQFWLALQRMCEAGQPLVTVKNGGNVQNGARAMLTNSLRKAKFEITDAGKSVLKMDADFVELNGIELWLGGAHLSGKGSLWRWDEESGEIVSA